MNKVIMMGRIVNELELKTTPQGTLVCSFRIAVDRNFQKKGEERKSDFFNVVAWRNTAEFITRWFGKGRMILIEGELQTRQYTDKNGNPSTWYEILVDNAYFTGEKANNPQGGMNSYGNAGGYQQNGYNNNYAPQGNYAPQSAPAPQPAPQQPAGNGGAPADFKGATDDNYPF